MRCSSITTRCLFTIQSFFQFTDCRIQAICRCNRTCGRWLTIACHRIDFAGCVIVRRVSFTRQAVGQRCLRSIRILNNIAIAIAECAISYATFRTVNNSVCCIRRAVCKCVGIVSLCLCIGCSRSIRLNLRIHSSNVISVTCDPVGHFFQCIVVLVSTINNLSYFFCSNSSNGFATVATNESSYFTAKCINGFICSSTARSAEYYYTSSVRRCHGKCSFCDSHFTVRLSNGGDVISGTTNSRVQLFKRSINLCGYCCRTNQAIQCRDCGCVSCSCSFRFGRYCFSALHCIYSISFSFKRRQILEGYKFLCICVSHYQVSFLVK